MVKVGDDVWYNTTRIYKGQPMKLHIGRVIELLPPPPGQEHRKPMVKIQRYRAYQKPASIKRRGSEGYIFSGYFPHRSDKDKYAYRFWIAKNELS